MFRVLVVDDEPMIRKGLAKLIQEKRDLVAEVETAENGAHALELMDRTKPDVLFTDIRMPKLDGLGLCRELADRDSGIPVVIVSGYSDFEYARECLAYGVKEYLLKPVGRKVVHETLKKLADRQRTRPPAYLSISGFDHWAKRFADTIWSLQHEAFEVLLGEWRLFVLGQNLDLRRLQAVLDEFAGLVADKLNSRDVYRFDPVWPVFPDGADLDDPFARFTAVVRGLYLELKSKRKGKVKDPVEEAKLYIEKHLAKDSSLEEVAELLGMNSSYFSQLFKQRTEETFVQYRTRRRIEKAKKLLEQPQIRITDISFEVGYADHPYFTKTFKKHTGYSPSEYRHSLGIEG